MQAKRCSKCGEEKPLDDFYRASVAKAGKHGRQAYCISCTQSAETARPRRVRDPEGRYFENVKRLYGLTREDYELRLIVQGGRCAACGDAPPPESTRRFLNVDHCHESGKVRGLLCLACNVALGKLRDDPTRIRALLEYISP